jgi:hypothetical protein
MGFIHGAHRHEAILFPERLDDYIAAENPVRFLDAFVDHLNLTMLGSYSRRRRMLLKINDLSHMAFVNIKSIESITYAFYTTSNGQVLN